MITKQGSDPLIQKPSFNKNPQPEKIRLRKTSASTWMINGVFISLILITLYTLTHLNTENVKMADAFRGLMMTLDQMFIHPNAGSDGFMVLLEALGVSVFGYFNDHYRCSSRLFLSSTCFKKFN